MTEIREGHAGRVRAEEDHVATGRIVAVGVIALVVFFCASVASTMALTRRRAEVWPGGPPPAPPEAGKAKIGIVEQRLFENTITGEEWLREQRRRLDGYGWVDRKAGVVHIPIDRAMDLELQTGGRP